MNDNYWFSANSRGQVVAKTEIHADGTVHRYEYSIPDDIHAGHGHQRYNSLQDFIRNHPEDADWERKREDSLNRRWKGQG